MAGGVVCLLLVNAAAERQSEVRIAGLIQGQTLIAKSPEPASAPGRSPFTRAALLTTLLRDSDSL
jgi:hypothetical protein